MSAWVVTIQQPLLRMLVEADSADAAVASARDRYAKDAGAPAERFSAAEPLTEDPETETPDDVPMGEADLILLARRVGRKVAYRIRVRTLQRADGDVPFVDVYYALVLPDERGRVRRYWHHHGSFQGVDAADVPLPPSEIEPLYLRHPELFELWEPPVPEVSPEAIQRARLLAAAILQACLVANEVPQIERDGETTTILVGQAGKTLLPSAGARGLTFQVGPDLFVMDADTASDHSAFARVHVLPSEAAVRDLAGAAVAWMRGGDSLEAMAAIWDRVFPPDPA